MNEFEDAIDNFKLNNNLTSNNSRTEDFKIAINYENYVQKGSAYIDQQAGYPSFSLIINEDEIADFFDTHVLNCNNFDLSCNGNSNTLKIKYEGINYYISVV